jgi:hypothetical protein
MLYHAEELKNAGVVCLCEGEKDADTVTKVEMLGKWGLVVGMTS